jgi:hypothetical protein
VPVTCDGRCGRHSAVRCLGESAIYMPADELVEIARRAVSGAREHAAAGGGGGRRWEVESLAVAPTFEKQNCIIVAISIFWSSA